MFLSLIIMILVGYCANYPTLILGDLVDRLISTRDDNTEFLDFIEPITLIILLFLIKEALTVLRKYIVEAISATLEKDSFIRLASHLFKANISSLQQYKAGALSIQIYRNIEGVTQLLKLIFIEFFPTVFIAVVAFLMIVHKSAVVAIVIPAVFLLSVIATLIQVNSQEGIRIKLFRLGETLGAKVAEVLANIEYVRACSATRCEEAVIKHTAGDRRETEFKHHKYMMSFDAVKSMIENLGFVAVVTVSIFLAIEKTITYGDILVFSTLYMSITLPLRELNRILDHTAESFLKLNDLMSLHDIPVQQISADRHFLKQTDFIKTTTPILEVANLNYQYGSDSDKNNLLKDINFSVTKGQFIGIAGATGCGKSTLVKVLLGLTDDYTGSIRIAGKELSNLDRESLYKNVSYLPQSAPIFSGTLLNNLTYGIGKDFDEHEIMNALDDSVLKQKVLNDYNGNLKFNFLEGGKNLSGGERQRILLSRFFLFNPYLAIFDESTSALDSKTQRLVYSSIKRAVNAGTTVIMIAHRLSILEETDEIIVMDDGQIVQRDNYRNLSRQKGCFAKLLESERVSSSTD